MSKKEKFEYNLKCVKNKYNEKDIKKLEDVIDSSIIYIRGRERKKIQFKENSTFLSI